MEKRPRLRSEHSSRWDTMRTAASSNPTAPEVSATGGGDASTRASAASWAPGKSPASQSTCIYVFVVSKKSKLTRGDSLFSQKGELIGVLKYFVE